MVIEYFLENLRALMETSSIDSVVSLAKSSGIPRGRINNWHSRHTIPGPDDLEKIAKFFNVEPYYFYMKPGSQGTVRPLERHDDFKILLDDLAEKCLNSIELETYRQEGPSEFVRVLRTNYESPHILPVKWCLKLNEELTKYTSVDLEKKLRSTLAGQDVKKGQVS